MESGPSNFSNLKERRGGQPLTADIEREEAPSEEHRPERRAKPAGQPRQGKPGPSLFIPLNRNRLHSPDSIQGHALRALNHLSNAAVSKIFSTSASKSIPTPRAISGRRLVSVIPGKVLTSRT